MTHEGQLEPVADGLYRIVAPQFVCSFDVRGGSVPDDPRVVAPAVEYMRGWTLTNVERHCGSRGWELERIADLPKAGHV